MILALTGPKGTGKSNLLLAAAAALEAHGLSLGGVISLSRMSGNKRVGYDLLRLPGRERELLALQEPPEGEAGKFTRWRAYSFSAKAIARGQRAIAQGLAADCLFLDEIGFWELEGGGWSRALPGLAGRRSVSLLGIRREVLRLTAGAWGFQAHLTLDLSETDHETALRSIVETTLRNRKGDYYA